MSSTCRVDKTDRVTLAVKQRIERHKSPHFSKLRHTRLRQSGAVAAL
ncbi:hypothetical protein [Caballeronia sp. 15711]